MDQILTRRSRIGIESKGSVIGEYSLANMLRLKSRVSEVRIEGRILRPTLDDRIEPVLGLREDREALVAIRLLQGLRILAKRLVQSFCRTRGFRLRRGRTNEHDRNQSEDRRGQTLHGSSRESPSRFMRSAIKRRARSWRSEEMVGSPSAAARPDSDLAAVGANRRVSHSAIS